MEQVLTYFVIMLFGSVFGSFMNVVIYRIPRKESISFPASHCTVCQTPIRWYDNIPIASYLMLRGKCRSCNSRISPLYPIVESTTTFIALILYIQYGPTLLFAKDFIFAMLLVAATVIDLRFMIIPNVLNAAGAVIACGFAVWQGYPAMERSFIGCLIGAGLILCMFLLGRIIYKRDGVGFGDVKLAGVMGLFIGPFWVLQAFIIAIMVGGIWAVGVLFSGKKKTGQEVPFGPFLAIGGFFTLFFKREILYLIDYYLALW